MPNIAIPAATTTVAAPASNPTFLRRKAVSSFDERIDAPRHASPAIQADQLDGHRGAQMPAGAAVEDVKCRFVIDLGAAPRPA
ncbi:hypothetical protein Ahu01nite_087580 [Winogradskya humida]|uniref:Uncharacterized protein n=1 Tax=Winogradskya humida TaxID=113566 RepID=A0ABQ4A484_9ACTN|nr:hypothetical protein Ahu01nite_087580 [Actinoplanes humidus]